MSRYELFFVGIVPIFVVLGANLLSFSRQPIC